MREIKFRAWDTDQGIMFIPLMIDWRNDYPECWRQRSQVSDDGEWLRGCTLMQFTGLLDKRGKEIYEGDIIKRTMHYGNDRGERCGKGEERLTEVKWLKHDGMKMVGFSFFPCDNINQLEVIGNIYENPELLEG